MQQQKVVSWLSQHNFPHGLVSFADGLSTDPLGHKATYLKNLIQVCAICKKLWLGKQKAILARERTVSFECMVIAGMFQFFKDIVKYSYIVVCNFHTLHI
jgi:hypothetical protein